MSANLIRERARQLAEKVRAWLNAPDGQRSMHEAAERALETTRELQNARKIDPSKLHVPFGPADGSTDWNRHFQA